VRPVHNCRVILEWNTKKSRKNKGGLDAGDFLIFFKRRFQFTLINLILLWYHRVIYVTIFASFLFFYENDIPARYFRPEVGYGLILDPCCPASSNFTYIQIYCRIIRDKTATMMHIFSKIYVSIYTTQHQYSAFISKHYSKQAVAVISNIRTYFSFWTEVENSNMILKFKTSNSRPFTVISSNVTVKLVNRLLIIKT